MVGARGEAQAAHFLQTHHYHLLARNYRVGHHEIDLIAFDPAAQEMVFVEVKTRRTSLFGHPSSAVGFAKLRSLRQAIKAWITSHPNQYNYRIDVITVLPQGIEHFSNVTW